jgi:hypothetical protein
MSKFDEKVDLYLSQFKELNISGIDKDLLTKVTKACGPAIYLPDASKVSLADETECNTVKKNFLMKKLGLTEKDDMDAGLAAAEASMGKSNKNKYRPMVYYLLTKYFKKESVFA